MDRQEDQGPPAGVTAHLTIPDGRAADAIAFYQQAFGAELAMEPVKGEDGRRIMHAHLRVNGGSLMLNDDFPEYGGGKLPPNSAIVLHLQVNDADAVFNRALDAGASETMPLADQFWGDRYGQVQDPFGITWSIGAAAVPKQD
jgi:PhnB protein